MIALLQSPCFSQTTTLDVSGRVFDTEGQPIPYATIVLNVLVKDTILLGAITNYDGFFTIRNVPRDRIKITVSFIGFASFSREISLTDEIPYQDLDSIVLKPIDAELQEVVVQGERVGLRALVDKYVFIPDAQSIKPSATGLDLISKIPGIRVRSRDQEISVAGSSNVLILVNGASSDRNLNAISPRDIERIEVIKNPGAAFESDVLAVLNIVLKSEREKGVYIATNLEYSFVNLQNNSNAQIDYIFDKLRVFAGYNLNVFKEKNVVEIRNRRDFEGNDINDFNSESPENLMRRESHRLQYGADYQINEKNALSFTGNMILSDFEDFQLTQSKLLQNNNTILQSNTNDMSFHDAKQHNYNLFYSLKFKPKQELKLNSNLFFMNRTRYDKYVNNTIYHPEMTTEQTNRSEETINEMRSINVKVDYSQPLKESTVWHIGYQLFHRQIFNDFIDSDNVINIDYLDYRNSFYGDFAFKKGKLSFRAGLRMEHLTINISDTLSNQDLHPLPLGSIMYSINQRNNIGLTYNRRLRYPSFQMLLPFDYYSGNTAYVSSGNPNLKPERQHSLTLRHTYKNNKLFTSTSLYYQKMDNVFGMVRLIDNGVLRSRWENIDWANTIGVRLSGNASFFDFIELDADINIYQSYYSSSQYNGVSYQTYLGLTCFLPSDISLGVDFSLGLSESRIDMQISESPFIEKISLSKDVFNGKGNLGCALINPTTVRFNMKSWDSSFEDISKLRYNTPVYLLKFTYFFSSGKKKQSLQREQIMQEEQIK